MVKYCPKCGSKMKYSYILDELECPDCGYRESYKREKIRQLWEWRVRKSVAGS